MSLPLMHRRSILTWSDRCVRGSGASIAVGSAGSTGGGLAGPGLLLENPEEEKVGKRERQGYITD